MTKLVCKNKLKMNQMCFSCIFQNDYLLLIFSTSHYTLSIYAFERKIIECRQSVQKVKEFSTKSIQEEIKNTVDKNSDGSAF